MILLCNIHLYKLIFNKVYLNSVYELFVHIFLGDHIQHH